MFLSSRRIAKLAPALAHDAAAAGERLGEAGLVVERVIPLRELLEPVVVGRVERVTPHPNADRLRVCIVDDGSGEPLQIVTGAENVREGGSYPVIRSGTRLPGGTKIKRGKLRGEVSEGMLGSADELELGEDHAGLFELPGAPAPGTPLPEVLPTEGYMLEIRGTPTEEEIAAALSGARAAAELQIDLFADIACPWCYIGESRLAAALAARPELRVVWRWNPFQLQQDLPAGGMPWEEFVATKFGGGDQASAMFDQVRAAAEGAGLDLRFERMTHAPNTADAHRLVLFAAERGLARETAEALFRDHFGNGSNVSETEVLVRVAAGVGIDEDDARALLSSDRFRDEVARSQENAGRLGIGGVPFYIFNGRVALSGAQPEETFGRAIEMALSEEG